MLRYCVVKSRSPIPFLCSRFQSDIRIIIAHVLPHVDTDGCFTYCFFFIIPFFRYSSFFFEFILKNGRWNVAELFFFIIFSLRWQYGRTMLIYMQIQWIPIKVVELFFYSVCDSINWQLFLSMGNGEWAI